MKKLKSNLNEPEIIKNLFEKLITSEHHVFPARGKIERLHSNVRSFFIPTVKLISQILFNFLLKLLNKIIFLYFCAN